LREKIAVIWRLAPPAVVVEIFFWQYVRSLDTTKLIDIPRGKTRSAHLLAYGL
jgi:hypothetical protein